MKSYRLYLLILSVSLLFQCSAPKSEEKTLGEQFDELLTYYHENGLFNGTILVAQEDSVIYRYAFGFSDFESEDSLIPESRFYLASVSKQFTTMAVMVLKERGLLSYSDKLSQYFEDFPDYADQVTIRHMMNHTSGIPDHYGLGAYKKGLSNQDVLELLILQDTLDFEPGSKYSYSNGGYVLLSMIVEKVSGQSFREFMDENIFEPTNMTNTTVYDETDPEVSNRAKGFDGGRLDDYEIYTTGAGGMYSNIDDLFKWHSALSMNTLVGFETINEAYMPTILTSGDTSDYGFGWGLNQEENWVGHSGGMNGYRTYLRRYLDTNLVFIFLTNNGNSLDFSLTDQLDNILTGDESVTLPKIPISNFISDNISEVNKDSLISAVNELISKKEEFAIDEGRINDLGYRYMSDKRMTLAKAVFLLNVNQFPNSSNVYDSYAELLLSTGDTTASIENYKKSVVLNPANQYGIEILDSLGISQEDFLKEVTVPISTLEKYVGEYLLDGEFNTAITLQGGQLMIAVDDQNPSPIFPSSEVRFYSKIVNAQLTFMKDEAGSINSFTLHQNGDYKAIRMD